MKKLFTFFAAIYVCSIQSIFATDVSGTISTDSVWNIGGSPYVITSSLTINHGVTLTVESGVTVKFNDNQYMYVYGGLSATSAVFTSNNPSPTPGIWGNIQVGNYSVSDSGNITLNSCQIQYSTYLYIYNGKANLTNTDLTNNSQYGIDIEPSGTLIMSGGNINTNSSWASSYGSGIYANSNAHISLSGVNIQHFQNGILLSNKSSVNVSNINISMCNWPISYNSSANLTIGGTNIFTGNTNQVVYMNFYNLSDTINLPVIPIPYFFPGSMTINSGAYMKIGSNNILKFQDGTTLDVYGTLVAKANQGENIYFTSYRDDNWGGDSNNDGTTSAPTVGNWYGIRFEYQSNDVNCLMRRCQVRYAGANNTGGINVINASPTIDSCNLSNNYFGFYIQYASNPVLTNNTIGSSQMTPIAMSFEANPTLANNILSFSDNAYDAIGLIGGILTANANLIIRSVTNVQNITYLLLNQVTIPSGISLTINKGIVIKSYSYNQQIIVNGTLTANASADSMITFTSAKDDNYGNPGDCNKDGTLSSPVVGDWGGIIFEPASTGTLNYCRIKYGAVWNCYFTNCSASEYSNDAAVTMIDASPTISNCEFNNLDYGISCYRESNPVISNDTMINIKYTPICISGSSNPTISGIIFTNVGWRAIGLLGGNVCQNGTIKKRDMAGFINITYVLLDDMTINSGTYVNVDPGVVIKVYNANYSNRSSIYVDGGFKTDGTSGQHVVFTSINDDNEGNPFDSNGDGNASTPKAGDWGSIKFRSTSDDSYCSLNYTSIKYAGNTNQGGATFENAGGKLTNSNITNSSNYGVYSNGNSNPLIDNVTIQNCNLDPIAISLTSNPTLNNITFISNNSQAIKIIEGTLSSNATLISRNVAGITNIAYIVSNLTISSNAKLIIQPGVVIKFREDNCCCYNPRIDVYGNLIANGTAFNKIYFTSYADDSKGGDSNNDGNTTIPAKGDWGTSDCYSGNGGIRFLNISIDADTVNSLKNCEISYAATGLYISNSHITLDSCLMQLCSYFGASVIGSANPDFKNCQFYNITYSPIELSMFSNPSFTNCTALNVGIMALSVYPETYSQNDTVPKRNFGGYNNISYFMEGKSTINSGTTITIPAGIVFKSNSGSYYNYYTSNIANGFIVNGRLNILGTAINPVIFTNLADDNYGNPKDMNQNGSATLPPDGINQGWSGNWITFNDVSDDSSMISNAIFKYGAMGIATLSASPAINHVLFENLNYGVDMNGVSSPKIDTCTFNNLQYYPIQISLVSYPASASNNTISGTTYKVIKVRDETLTQDVTLPKRNFGGKTNIPFLFGNYTIGTGATLTINPGVICKFYNDSWWYKYSGGIDIFKGLNATGGSSPDSNIVFTDIRDDFYGGDSNSDSTATTPTSVNYPYGWSGLIFEDQSLDPLCKLKNCIIRFADKGIKTNSASPLVQNCNINNNNYGVYVTAASNPSFSNCDFSKNYYFSVDNVDKSYVINAENCWWGNNLGPIQSNSPGNATSEQEIVTTSVDYTPWLTNGSQNPVMGDVSLNGTVTAYDASLILKYVVSSVVLDTSQLVVANVSGQDGVTAYDASLILQYVVNIITTFPVEEKLKSATIENKPSIQLSFDNISAQAGDEISIPVTFSGVSGVLGLQAILVYDTSLLKVKNVEFSDYISTMYAASGFNTSKGEIKLAFAGSKSLNTDGIPASIIFNVAKNIQGIKNTQLKVKQFIVNEVDMSKSSQDCEIMIIGNGTGVKSTDNLSGIEFSIYPNPFNISATIKYSVQNNNSRLTIEVMNVLGSKVAILESELKTAGKYSIHWNGTDSNNELLPDGIYFIRLQSGEQVKIQKVRIIR